MTEHEASRTLVKSPPELWAECSEAASLARHIGSFGEIRITRLQPESAVAWEGTLASGTVRLEPSGWGTRVILTAREQRAERRAAASAAAPSAAAESEAAPETVVEPEAPEPGPDAVAPAPARKPGLFARLLAIWRPASGPPSMAVVAASDPPRASEPPSASDPPRASEPPSAVDVDHAAVLAAALDSLGQAHHRPFSRG